MDYEDTSLHEAVRFNDSAEVTQALSLGEDPNAVGFYKWTALHEAVSISNPDIVKLLLERGGDPNMPDLCKGNTPLHMASSMGQIDCVRLLLSFGGDRALRNDEGRTSLELTKDDAIISLFQTFAIEEHTQKGADTPKLSVRRNSTEAVKLSRPNSVTSLLSSGSLRNSPTYLSRPGSSLSVRSVASVRSAESVLTTRSSPVRGTRTTRKPVGATPKHVSRSPGIRLSVEYSEQSEVLKVRVWSLQSLTVSPDVANGNGTIHVRSCVFPGTKIWSKTEDNPVEKYLPCKDAESGEKGARESYTEPVCLQQIPLDRKMTFKHIPESALTDKNIEIAVCAKTPGRVSSKIIYLAKLFLKCEEAANVVMPKWFLMTSCSIEKSRNSTPLKGSRVAAGSWDPPSLRSPSQSSSISVSAVQITEPIEAGAPPKGRVGIKNPFKRDPAANLARATAASRDTRLNFEDSDEPAYKGEGNRLQFLTGDDLV